MIRRQQRNNSFTSCILKLVNTRCFASNPAFSSLPHLLIHTNAFPTVLPALPSVACHARSYQCLSHSLLPVCPRISIDLAQHKIKMHLKHYTIYFCKFITFVPFLSMHAKSCCSVQRMDLPGLHKVPHWVLRMAPPFVIALEVQTRISSYLPLSNPTSLQSIGGTRFLSASSLPTPEPSPFLPMLAYQQECLSQSHLLLAQMSSAFPSAFDET